MEHNPSALKLLGAQGASADLHQRDFFMTLLGWQSMMALFLASFIGPGQISPDLANNALVAVSGAARFPAPNTSLGKMSVLLILMSLMTWVPGLLLFALQGYLEGWQWMGDNARIAGGVFFGAWIWILMLSLLALALSAWVKWKPAAGALMFGVFFVAAGFGGTINGVQRTSWGHLFNISHLIGTVWVQLFEGSITPPTARSSSACRRARSCRCGAAGRRWRAFAGICLYMLARKIRGAEVVR